MKPNSKYDKVNLYFSFYKKSYHNITAEITIKTFAAKRNILYFKRIVATYTENLACVLNLTP